MLHQKLHYRCVPSGASLAARYSEIYKLIERKKQLNANKKVTLDISVDCQVERGEVVVIPQLDGEASVYL